MKDQLIKLINHYGLTAAKLADKIGVQPSSISHILSGRNKPSYDFILSLIDNFPEINPKWLLTGKDNMFLDVVNTEKVKKNQISEPTLFSNELTTGEPANFFTDDSNVKTKEEKKEDNNKTDYKSNAIGKFTNVNEAKYVILLYDDMTFVQFKNKKE